MEPYFQMHWNEVRGLDRKYAVGGNLRWRLIFKPTTGLFAGIGPFYEYERWDYRNVEEELIPPDARPVETNLIRFGSYLSFKKHFANHLLDVSFYLQDRVLAPFKSARLGSSIRMTFNVSKMLGLSLLYQNIYDPRPLVPINKLYNDFRLSVNITL